jgi:hypothetical protein
VKDHAIALSQKFNTHISVVSPYSLPFTSKFRNNNSELISGNSLEAQRVRYFSFPNRSFPALIKNSLSKKLISTVKKKEPYLIHVHFLYSSGLA